MAHTKTGAAHRGNRDSVSKRLGVKIYGGQKAFPGNILIRQRGTQHHPGPGVKMGKDFTVYAIKEGIVRFNQKWGRKVVSVGG